ncbi:3-dehydro-L-gulonate 2-dehydrogenase [Alkalibacter rhizosphaerae]|uniref:3-dehydro-L-gulonate 2-dehydrogenase n=1 Tax=Alkalibacter rhizosphaerae TaxID=2815577 RepID=A0A974XG15_9FIRM|nr:3-dehydro-L-gulonate 2-dehydrogenase [Alkalibacter rhizosphaerae]QSX09192.1 3-dehydro-L-gulonate 2-dehydrogenase [Alkalibacter rhizosphaerae]
MRLTFDEIYQEIKNVFMKNGLSEEKASLCAKVHTESTYDGIYSHGVNRVARFVEYLKNGWVNADGEPVLEKEFGAIQVYNGNRGPGVLNGIFAVDRAMELADKFGIGLVGLKNTTHWMRGGTYGLRAAQKGYIAIMWTNTEANMPPWGAKESRLGNNPLVLAAPGEKEGEELLLDMAISQYSYGKLEVTRQAGKNLPYPGGFDEDGNLTDDPGVIEASRRILPVGYWKGSGLSFMLDILGSVLTEGMSTADMEEEGIGNCTGASQVMIVIDPDRTTDRESMLESIRNTIRFVKGAEKATGFGKVSVPGDGMRRFRKEHDELGIYVDDVVWERIKGL